MRRITNRLSTRALIGCLTAATLALAACGGSDDPEPAQPSPTDAPSSDGADTQIVAGGSDDAGAANSDRGEIIDQLDDGMGAGVDEALDSLPDGAIWSVVADQLGDNVDVDIEGADIQLTLNEGNTDDGIMDCLIAGAFVEEGQVITMIYPDGDVTCD